MPFVARHVCSFFISLCNTAPLFTVHNDSEWEEMIYRDWLPALAHPSYLRVDGRLVFKVINAPMFYQVGGEAGWGWGRLRQGAGLRQGALMWPGGPLRPMRRSVGPP